MCWASLQTSFWLFQCVWQPIADVKLSLSTHFDLIWTNDFSAFYIKCQMPTRHPTEGRLLPKCLWAFAGEIYWSLFFWSTHIPTVPGVSPPTCHHLSIYYPRQCIEMNRTLMTIILCLLKGTEATGFHMWESTCLTFPLTSGSPFHSLAGIWRTRSMNSHIDKLKSFHRNCISFLSVLPVLI